MAREPSHGPRSTVSANQSKSPRPAAFPRGPARRLFFASTSTARDPSHHIGSRQNEFRASKSPVSRACLHSAGAGLTAECGADGSSTLRRRWRSVFASANRRGSLCRTDTRQSRCETSGTTQMPGRALREDSYRVAGGWGMSTGCGARSLPACATGRRRDSGEHLQAAHEALPSRAALFNAR